MPLMNLFKHKKGQNVMVSVLILIVILFFFAVIYLSLFPMWQATYDFLEPLLSGICHETLYNWRKTIIVAPFVAFILALIWVVMEIVRDRQSSPRYP